MSNHGGVHPALARNAKGEPVLAWKDGDHITFAWH